MLWDDKYSIGVDLIDGQHKRLFKMLEEVYTNPVDNTLVALLDYTTYHFATEMQYMRNRTDIDIYAHNEEHQMFQRHLRELINANTTKLGLANFIRLWIVNHVLKVDKLL